MNFTPRCPICHQQVQWETSPARPFCSERCQLIDLGAWASERYRVPAEPGVVFTIEPGLYDEENGIGVRIEDVVVITEDGCEVITSLVPKELDEVEALVRSEGVLDLVDGHSD